MAVEFRHENSKTFSCDESTDFSTARMRWKMLAKALQEGRVQDCVLFPCSIRQFSTFGLLQMTPTEGIENDNSRDKWFLCSCYEEPRLNLKIKKVSGRISTDELKGFDNTGNVCIWPSEEVLTYYCMKNKELFEGKSVCELGGGMVSLCGLAIAATSEAKEVLLTDGNEKCVENAQSIIDQNASYFGKTQVKSRFLRWDVTADVESKFDVIVCADCLYYNEGRLALADTIWSILKNDGMCLVLSPTRGKSFQSFVDLVRKDFEVERLMAYDTHVWDLNCRLKESKSRSYVEDLHYPQMLILRKI